MATDPTSPGPNLPTSTDRFLDLGKRRHGSSDALTLRPGLPSTDQASVNQWAGTLLSTEEIPFPEGEEMPPSMPTFGPIKTKNFTLPPQVPEYFTYDHKHLGNSKSWMAHYAPSLIDRATDLTWKGDVTNRFNSF